MKQNKKYWILNCVPASVFAVLAAPAFAATVPFTETFDADHANWADGSNMPLSWSAAGGADGEGFAFGSFNFQNAQTNADLIVLRGSQSSGASGGAFVGNWLDEGITGFSTYVRHDAAVPMTFFARFAGPMNFPAGVAINFAPIPPNQWTLIEIPINAGNPQFVTFEGSTFESVFNSIGNVQIGVRTPEALAGVDTNVTFGLDLVTIVPEPATLGLLAMGAIVGLCGRRKRARAKAQTAKGSTG